MNKNILITSAGRRVSLIREFRESCDKLTGAKIFAADANPEFSAACREAAASFRVPLINSGKYIEVLLNICKDQKIGMLVPTIDTELLILSEHKKEFLDVGTHCIVSDSPFITRCRDKFLTHDFFTEMHIPVPALYEPGKLKYPVFIRPKNGSASKDIFVAHNINEIPVTVLNNKDFVFSEYLDPDVYEEYTADIYYGRDNKMKCVVPRKRIEIRAGEVSKSITCKNQLVTFLKQHLSYLPGVTGCINIQLFYNYRESKIFGIEINPRFGGGYPLSYHAGANFPALLIDEYFLQRQPEYTDNWDDNVLMLRYDDEIIVR